ncbi:FtsB family cell division protein [Peribacillus sp. NPDC096540]|uniref:FtsB family cell division protein n=1 Tax=Peribacillus sp. NPDC096540 TaxID=3390612 RepID=UPI003CFE0F5A
MSSLRKRKVAKIENPYVALQEKKVQTVEKKKRGLMRRLTLYSVFAAIFLILAVSTLITQNIALDEKVQQKEKLDVKLAKLEKGETLLKEEIVKLNDDDYIAKIARRDYFLSDKGEIIFNLPKAKEDID